jgi:hypothetical protein
MVERRWRGRKKLIFHHLIEEVTNATKRESPVFRPSIEEGNLGTCNPCNHSTGHLSQRGNTKTQADHDICL